MTDLTELEAGPCGGTCEHGWTEGVCADNCYGPDCPHWKENTMKVTAKFMVQNRQPFGTESDPATIVTLMPDYADERNKEWAWATPAGSVSLTIRNSAPAADFFTVGKKLTVTFEEDDA